MRGNGFDNEGFDNEAAIIGTGFSGMAAAIALGRAGIDPGKVVRVDSPR